MLEQHPYAVTLALIFAVGPIGLFDVIYFHIYRFKLAQRPESTAETITHILRGILMATLILVLVSYRPQGMWFWAVGGLLALDTLNSFIDVFLEPKSRQELGGLPRLEYIIHIGGAFSMGAITFSYFAMGWHLQELPTELVCMSGIMPEFTYYNGLLAAAFTLLLGAYETYQLLCSRMCSSVGGPLLGRRCCA